MTRAERIQQALAGLVGTDATAFVVGADPDEPEGDMYLGSALFAELVDRAMPTDQRVYVVTAPGWENEFDSVWSTEELALARADVLDPHPDKDGIRWGIVGSVVLDGDPEGDGTEDEGPAYVTTVERPGNAEALARLVSR